MLEELVAHADVNVVSMVVLSIEVAAVNILGVVRRPIAIQNRSNWSVGDHRHWIVH